MIPSLWECWPNVAREALLHNRPIVATPVGGLTEMVVPGRSGWLADGNDERAIGRCVDAVLDERAEIERLIADRRAACAPRRGRRRTRSARVATGGYGGRARRRGGTADVAWTRRPAGRPRRVSVIVPYFHLEQHVEETLDSVLAQTHRDVEIIVANDGSLRDADAIVFELDRRYGARVVTQPNSGLGAARNFGVSQATGEFVLPLDADDTLEPEFLERCLTALRARPELAYVTTWVQYVDQDGEPFGDDLGGYLPFGNWSALMRHNQRRRHVLVALPPPRLRPRLLLQPRPHELRGLAAVLGDARGRPARRRDPGAAVQLPRAARVDDARGRLGQGR